MGILNSLFRNKKEEKTSFLEAIQIEVSSICNLKCIFCPTTYYQNSGDKKLLPIELYKNIIPYFPWAKWIYLQGWGEPLLNPFLWEMVSLAKASGRKVGLTTNGTLIDKKAIEQIFDTHLDLISISIAGSKSSTHNKIRVNSNLEDILKVIQNLVDIKKAKKVKLPIITVSYMLTKDTISELPMAIELIHNLGVNDFYTTNLDYVFNKITNKHKVFTYFKNPDPLYKKYLLEAKNYANKNSFSFRAYPLEVKEQLHVCDLNPNKFVFITTNGDVSPCTYLGLQENPRYFNDQYFVYPKKIFGNLGADPLDKIWSKGEYVDFRFSFLTKEKAFNNLFGTLTDSRPNIYELREEEKKYNSILKDNPVPMECQNCHKIYGI